MANPVNLPELVRAVVDQHRDERGPLIEILHDIQHRLGYIDPDAVPLIAKELNLSRADVHGVVTFYKDFRSEPTGSVALQVCRAEACQSVGAERLVGTLEEALGIKVGGTTADGTTTLDQVFCLGNCALGPSAQINGRVYGRLNADRVLALLLTETS
ncbi:NAD(P)H-dependent oxidoreductase subunit E [Mycobacterium aquaticum]|uniref:NADH dehydrogenase n=1 Tax=Mycobacterium aquaticum TaxID=1927124 RepID=A0A1X0AAK1_9MYCO|nr:NAD(P)H-dependent oxidoreductase subunit E [Mycobacterium aquaticum]ORA26935.1 NADH dehydrogenase [Mycobacterium aquaticum]